MGIIELLRRIGDENCNVQSIQQNLIKVNLANNQAELTFVTAPQNAPSLKGVSKNIGIVVWVDKEIFDEAINKAPAEVSDGL